jgi:hypothetical protein
MEDKDNDKELMQWLATHCMGCEELIGKETHKKNNGYCDNCRAEQIQIENELGL